MRNSPVSPIEVPIVPDDPAGPLGFFYASKYAARTPLESSYSAVLARMVVLPISP
jgi:hypothetical protein